MRRGRATRRAAPRAFGAVYPTTWEAEGSRASRFFTLVTASGTADAGSSQAAGGDQREEPTSEPETAFRVTNDRRGAGAALRRPDAEHRLDLGPEFSQQ